MWFSVSVTTDAAEFEAALRDAARAESDAERARLLTTAVDLHGGELLPGSYEPWVLTERERLAAAYVAAPRQLAAARAQQGDFEGAIEAARRAVQQHLGWDAAAAADDDIKRALGAMSTLVDAIGSLRTHAGSAHGQGRGGYELRERHATLAVNASYTLATFVIQTWNNRSGK